MALNFPDNPVNEQFYEGFVYDSAAGVWRVTKGPPSSLIRVTYGIVGGGGGTPNSGGGGGGGFRSSYPNTNTGGGVPYPENDLALSPGNYILTVGAGGAPSSTAGGDSIFATVTAFGGGSGSRNPGGSGSGATGTGSIAGASGTYGQGFAGGATQADGYGGWRIGAGGGAGGPGSFTNKGAGRTTDEFTGTSVLFSEGGKGRGANGIVTEGDRPFANDGCGNNSGGSRSGNPGLVSITVETGRVTSIGAGLVYTSTVVGNNTRYVFTAGSDVVAMG